MKMKMNSLMTIHKCLVFSPTLYCCQCPVVSVVQCPVSKLSINILQIKNGGSVSYFCWSYCSRLPRRSVTSWSFGLRSENICISLPAKSVIIYSSIYFCFIFIFALTSSKPTNFQGTIAIAVRRPGRHIITISFQK